MKYMPSNIHSDSARDIQSDNDKPISQAQMLEYLHTVENRSIIYINELHDSDYLNEVTCYDRKWTMIEIIISQIRHMQHHIGYINSILKRNNEKPVTWMEYNSNGLNLEWYKSFLLKE
jgi:hypothetical protein